MQTSCKISSSVFFSNECSFYNMRNRVKCNQAPLWKTNHGYTYLKYMMFLWQCANVQQRLFPIFATSSWKFQFQRKFFKYPGEQELATISFTKWYTIKYRTKPTSRRIWLAGHMYRGRVILESARKRESMTHSPWPAYWFAVMAVLV